MKKEIKEEIKKNVATGASTAAGATAGVVIGASVSTAEAQTTPEPEPVPEPEPTPTPEPIHVIIDNPVTENHHNMNGGNEVIADDLINNPINPVNDVIVDTVTPDSIVRVVAPGNPEAQADVVGYDRITAEDGNQIDVAVVNVDGQEYGIADINLDGQADMVACDLNNNGVMDEGEVQLLEPGTLDMQPLQDAAGFNPLYAQNDMLDYTNDADVDTYMA